MKILIICSKTFYYRIPIIKAELESMGHNITLPNSYNDPTRKLNNRRADEHADWQLDKIKQKEKEISSVDSILVLNYSKNGLPNYIGGCTFLKMYDAFRLGKTIYIMNPIPEGILKAEIFGLKPIIIKGNLNQIEITDPKEQIYNKLIRDKIPEIIKANGEQAITRILDEDEFKTELDKKGIEEYNEFLEATTSRKKLEELGDMLEIISSQAELEGTDLEEIITIMNQKREERGGFSKKLFLEKVITK